MTDEETPADTEIQDDIPENVEQLVAELAEWREKALRAAAEAVLGKRRCEQVEAFIDDLERKQDAGKLAGLCAVQGAAGVAARTARRGALQQIGRPDGLH